jgi:hypothetical protein
MPSFSAGDHASGCRELRFIARAKAASDNASAAAGDCQYPVCGGEDSLARSE